MLAKYGAWAVHDVYAHAPGVSMPVARGIATCFVYPYVAALVSTHDMLWSQRTPRSFAQVRGKALAQARAP